MIMTCALVVVLLSATEDALKLQVVSDGIPAHSAGESGIVPLKPFMPVNVSVVDPVPPGALIDTVVDWQATVNVGAAVTTSAVMPVEVA